jgi:ATP-binding cassette subfamily A (ABC1) protein 3
MYAYWVSTYVFDMLCYFIPAGAAVLALVQLSPGIFTGDSLNVLMLSFALSGWAVIPFTYFVSFAFSSHSRAQVHFTHAHPILFIFC